MRVLRLAVLPFLFAGATGCPSCAPQTVAEGVARLTVRNVGAIVILLGNDTRCGFASDAAKRSAVVTGDIGGQGSVTTTVNACTFDFGSAGGTILDDCNGDVLHGTGKVTVDAKQTVTGLLTGDPQNPIIPANPDAATVTITRAAFDNFTVTKTGSSDRLTNVDGSLSAVAKPRLAVSASTGVCAIPTLTTAFSDIRYAPSTTVDVKTATHNFDAPVDGSSISAQTGQGAASENSISGMLTVFHSNENVEGDGQLDPDYSRGGFVASYACNADTKQPVSFACTDPTQAVADASARLSVKLLGTVASLVDADTSCGFSSAAAQGSAVVTGTPGGPGTITFTVDQCALHFHTQDVLTDCTGASTVVDGDVVVSGKKTVSGVLSGDPAAPIVPGTDLPASLDLTVHPDHFSVSSTNDANAITATSGTLSGVVHPRAFVGAETGVCSVATPNATFEGVTWTNGDLVLTSAQGSFPATVDTSTIEATNGTAAGRTNTLSGSVTVGGKRLSVPSDNAGLDPTFSESAFNATWQCNPALAQPISASCTSAVAQQLANGVGALTMRTFATVAAMIDADTTCGFASKSVASSAAVDQGNGGGDGSLTFTLSADGCVLSLPKDTIVAQDCSGNSTRAGGRVVVKGTKTVTGFLTGDATDPIVPTSNAPAELTLTMEFESFDVTASDSKQDLAIARGSVAGSIRPRTALDQATGVCSVVTPNATFSDIAWHDGEVTLHDGDAAFGATIEASNLTAQAGSDGTTTNQLTGTIELDHRVVRLNGPLDPSFDPATFNASFLCDTGSGVPVLADDAACSFRRVLGDAAARLLVETAAVATSILQDDAHCGFADKTPAQPPVVMGTAGAPGNVTLLADPSCSFAFDQNTAIATDCNGDVTSVSGMFTATSASESVNGLVTGDPANPVLPTARDAATITLKGVSFEGFRVVVDATSDVTVNGALDVVVHPIAGRDAAASAAASATTGGLVNDVFSVPTPVAAISSLTMPTGALAIAIGGKVFHVPVSDVSLNAMNGSFAGVANTIAGTLKVDGEEVVLPAGSPLVTPYDQAAFDASYACNPALAGDIVPP